MCPKESPPATKSKAVLTACSADAMLGGTRKNAVG